MITGQSKKVFVGVIALQMIGDMSDDPDKFPFAVIVGVLTALYIGKQTILDWLSSRGNDNKKDNGDKL